MPLEPARSFVEARIRDFDPDCFLEAISGGEIEHFLLGPGRCSADLQHWSATGVSVDRGIYRFGVLAQGSFRPGHIVLGIAGGPQGGPRINGFDVDDRDLQFYAEGSEVFYRAERANHWTAIQCERRHLHEAADGLGVKLPGLPRDGAVNLAGAIAAGGALAPVIESVLEDARENPSASGRLAICVLDAAVDALASSAGRQDLSARVRWSQRRIEIVRRAQQQIYLRRDEPYDSARLCRDLGISERTLQLYFRQLLGLSPRRWDRCMRLHGVRRDLVAARPGQVRVTDVALRWGFEHLGRFSASYRDLFGSTPSETGLSRSATG